MATWITPKTDWVKTDSFTYTDYNRIKNNLTYLNDLFNSLAPEKAVEFDFGEDYDYANNYDVDIFNMFEECLQSFTRIGSDVNVGDFKVHKGNSQFLDYDDLNRIEKCCVNWLETTRTGVKSVTVTPASFEFYSGNEFQLVATVLPEDAYNKNVTWSSSDTSVATVDENGLVNAIGRGNVTITCTTVDGHKTATATGIVHSLVVFPFNVIGSNSVTMGYSFDFTFNNLYLDIFKDDVSVPYNMANATNNYTNVGSCVIVPTSGFFRRPIASGGSDTIKLLKINSEDCNYEFSINVVSSGYRIYCANPYYLFSPTEQLQYECATVRTGYTQQCYCRTLTSTSNVTSGNTWYSSNPSIFTVNSSGVITGVSEGVAILGVKHSNNWAFSVVQVFDVPTTVTTPSTVSLPKATSNKVVAFGDSGFTPSKDYKSYIYYDWSYSGTGIALRKVDTSIYGGNIAVSQTPTATSGTLTIKFVTTSGLVTKNIAINITS